jgi:nucleoside-diphosphate-sugar epimerase
MTKILITGVSGFSGRYIDGYLINKEYDVNAHFGRGESGRGLEDPYTLQSWTEPTDVLVHIAAQSPDVGITDTDIYKNIPMTYNLIQYAKRVGIKKIIYFSSDSIYGDPSPLQMYMQGMNRISDTSFYGLTKLVCEGLLKDSGIPTVVLRLPLIVGPGAKRNWLARMMQNVKEGKPVTIYNPRGLFNNVVHIQYVAEVVENLINSEFEEQFAILLPRSTQPLTIRKVVNKIVRGKVPILEASGSRGVDLYPDDTIPPPWTTETTIDRYVQDES